MQLFYDIFIFHFFYFDLSMIDRSKLYETVHGVTLRSIDDDVRPRRIKNLNSNAIVCMLYWRENKIFFFL